jgi:hypothetical protein
MTMTSRTGKRLARALAAAAAAVGLFVLMPPATAGPCGIREQIVKDITATFREKRAAIGLLLTGDVLEVFVSPAGTWTIVVSKRSGIACIVAAGEVWMQEPVHKGPEA